MVRVGVGVGVTVGVGVGVRVLAGEPAAAERDGPRLRGIVRSPAPLLDQSVEVQRPVASSE